MPELNPFLFDARPHPGPLPQERVKHLPPCGDARSRDECLLPACRQLGADYNRRARISQARRYVLPLLGERAGVRAVVTTDMQKSPQVRLSPPESASVRLFEGEGGTECGTRNRGQGVSVNVAMCRNMSLLFLFFPGNERIYRAIAAQFRLALWNAVIRLRTT